MGAITTWLSLQNTKPSRRNIFNWKSAEFSKLQTKVKSFCNTDHVLGLLKNFIVFAEKDEERNKYILHQHHPAAVLQSGPQ